MKIRDNADINKRLSALDIIPDLPYPAQRVFKNPDEAILGCKFSFKPINMDAPWNNFSLDGCSPIFICPFK
jgi:hypothetical protein